MIFEGGQVRDKGNERRAGEEERREGGEMNARLRSNRNLIATCSNLFKARSISCTNFPKQLLENKISRINRQISLLFVRGRNRV